jgi:hypothetical protein
MENGGTEDAPRGDGPSLKNNKFFTDSYHHAYLNHAKLSVVWVPQQQHAKLLRIQSNGHGGQAAACGNDAG